jgi:hypothetical protein
VIRSRVPGRSAKREDWSPLSSTDPAAAPKGLAIPSRAIHGLAAEATGELPLLRSLARQHARRSAEREGGSVDVQKRGFKDPTRSHALPHLVRNIRSPRAIHGLAAEATRELSLLRSLARQHARRSAEREGGSVDVQKKRIQRPTRSHALPHLVRNIRSPRAIHGLAAEATRERALLGLWGDRRGRLSHFSRNTPPSRPLRPYVRPSYFRAASTIRVNSRSRSSGMGSTSCSSRVAWVWALQRSSILCAPASSQAW